MASERAEEKVPQGSEKAENPQGEDTQKKNETKKDTQSKTEEGQSAQDSKKGENKEGNDKSEKDDAQEQSGENESGERKHGAEKAQVSKEALEGPQGEPAKRYTTEPAPGGMCCRLKLHWNLRRANGHQMIRRLAPAKIKLATPNPKTTRVRARLVTPRVKRRINLQMQTISSPSRNMGGPSDI